MNEIKLTFWSTIKCNGKSLKYLTWKEWEEVSDVITFVLYKNHCSFIMENRLERKDCVRGDQLSSCYSDPEITDGTLPRLLGLMVIQKEMFGTVQFFEVTHL